MIVRKTAHHEFHYSFPFPPLSKKAVKGGEFEVYSSSGGYDCDRVCLGKEPAGALEGAARLYSKSFYKEAVLLAAIFLKAANFFLLLTIHWIQNFFLPPPNRLTPLRARLALGLFELVLCA